MLLKNKNAVIYGAGGSLGGAIARAFAQAGANLYLSGHHLSPVKKLAEDIIKDGGKAEVAEVDALDEKAVEAYLVAVSKKAGTVDISFNLISLLDKQNTPLTELKKEDFTRPLFRAIETHFITDTAVARLMQKQGSGVILSLSATPGGIGYANTGGFGPACKFIESFSTNLASELGPSGVRVVNIRSAGSPDSKVFKDAIEQGGERVAAFIDKIKNDTMLKEMPLMDDIANVAVFLCSHMAAKITGVTVDVTAGSTAALNYKVTDVAFLDM